MYLITLHGRVGEYTGNSAILSSVPRAIVFPSLETAAQKYCPLHMFCIIDGNTKGESMVILGVRKNVSFKDGTRHKKQK